MRFKGLHLNGTPAPDRLWSVETLRLYAVLGVVTGHSLAYAKHTSGVTGGLDFSKAGLDIFFIISGLLVWRITRTRETRPALFFLHRISRLAPIYWISTLLYLAFISITGQRFGLTSGFPTGSEIVKSLAFIPYFNVDHGIFPVLEPGWTLPFDVWYFAIFSVVLLAPKKWQLATATGLYCSAALAHAFRIEDPIAQVVTHPRALDFLGGIWIAHALERGYLLPRLAGKVVAVTSTIAMMGFIIAGVPARGVTFVFWAAAGCIGTYAMASIEGRGGAWKAFPQFPLIGTASYTIYLLQPISIMSSCMLVPGGVWPKFMVGLATSLVLGVAAHFALERPLNSALRGFERKRGLRPQANVTVAP